MSEIPTDENTRVVFLDVDGVLNDIDSYDWTTEPKPQFVQRCIKAFNRIIETRHPKIVVSSSWRMLYHSGNMSRNGFEAMLRSHGMRGGIIDFTTADAKPDRHEEISEWLSRHKIGKYVVLDDWDDAGGTHPFVQTNPALGLTDADADKAIELLAWDWQKA